MNEYVGLLGRNQAAKDIYTNICSKKGDKPSDVLILGRHGTGKKYIQKKVIKMLQKQPDFSALRFAGDQVVEQGKRYSLTQKEFSLSLSVYIGLSWSSSEKNNSKMDYLLNCLKKVEATHIVFFVFDLEECHSEAKDILSLLLSNKNFIEKQLSKTVTVLASACDPKAIGDFGMQSITLPCYTLSDVKEYVEEVLCYHPDSNECEAKYQKLQEICNSDLSLVNLLYRDLFENDMTFSISLNRLVSKKLRNLKHLGEEQSIKPKDMEEIIMTCSLSAEYFSRFEISETTKRSEEVVNDSFQISIKEQFFKQISKNLFDFTSPDIKGVLEEEMITRHNTRLLDYYNYLTQYRTDEYFLRAYYLIRYDRTISENSYSLLILAVEQAYMFKDEWMEAKIRELIEIYGDLDMMVQYDHIVLAYQQHKSQKYKASLQELSNIDDFCLGIIGKVELERLKFKNYYLLAQTSSFEFMQAVLKLKKAVQEPLALETQEGLLFAEEKIFKLKIIYDIAPYILDTENNYAFFQKLYDKIRLILSQEKRRSSRAKTIQYINNIFNRKAFLFANPMAAMPYYDEAKAFFRKNYIWDEYCITLASQAGTCLACHQYNKAVDFCEEAYRKIQEFQISIPKKEKLDNNYKIAGFLALEEQSADATIPEQKARQIANELELMAVGPACGTKHVLLTNASSLYLYSGELEQYQRTKKKIESSLSCHDVSDILDTGINDFYRYHFAWFEVFYHMQRQEWEVCEMIMEQLDGFVPALFKKQETLWQEKNKATLSLIAHKTIVTGYQFSTHLVEPVHRETTLSQFYHRGLMLSDLQYTSYN